ncbi:MAG: bifunctional hydroxymethylpyrimidine kinase/phosphomethylpyrimidine kinase [Lachnospiraceae bacterium]|nr:bifunctional hydroxymethylpyrimidine kinase/phosphomethylpyrimidine kinase [Lachnospiraceae bacterium]
MRKTALTIAGSDCSGGAGIQADIKTMLANGVYAMSAITSLTAQNTMGVAQIADVTEDFLAAQLDCIFTDIFPDAVKIGMMSSSGLIHVTAKKLMEYNARNIVVDTVMVSTSGTSLICDDAVEDLKEELFPLAALITPNIPEAEVLCGFGIHNETDMELAAKRIGDTYGCAVLCKGGHNINSANDVLYENNSFIWYEGKRIHNPNTHGTGCTLSSAIAAGLAKGYGVDRAVKCAKEYISTALAAMLNLGKGSGPLDHGAALGK